MNAPNFSDKQFALHMLSIEEGYVGTTRVNDPAQILKFAELGGFGSINVAFCDLGQGYSACKTWCDLTSTAYTAENAVDVFRGVLPDVKEFIYDPSASCAVTWAGTPDSQRVDDLTTILPGYLVVFNWNGGDVPDHIGMAKTAPDQNGDFQTVEFNTSNPDGVGSERNGGCVEVKTRNINSDYMVGAIRTYTEAA